MRLKSSKTYFKNLIALILCTMFFCLPMMGCANIFSNNNSSSSSSSTQTPSNPGSSGGSGTPSEPLPPTPSTTPDEEDHTDDYTDPNGSEEYLPIEDMFLGFNILSEDKDTALVFDNITSTYKTFNDLLKRQTETLADDILHRLDAIWGDGFSANYNLKYNFSTTDNNGQEYLAFLNGENNQITILTRETLLPLLQPEEDETFNEFKYQHTHEDLDNFYIDCPACYAECLSSGKWQSLSANLLSREVDLASSINGGKSYVLNGINAQFEERKNSYTYRVVLTIDTVNPCNASITIPIQDDTEITYIQLDTILQDSQVANFLKENLTADKTCTISFEDQPGTFVENSSITEATIESSGSSYVFKNDDLTVDRYYLDYPVYAKTRFIWDIWGSQNKNEIITRENREKLELAIANILASGQPDTYSDLNQCFNNIDHLGILSDRDGDTEFNTDAQKIVEYILTNIIGQVALDNDDEALNILTNSLTDNQLTSSSTIPTLGHYYKGYKLLVPEMVETAIHNCYMNVITSNTYSPTDIKKATDYPAYPQLPRVSSSYITYDSLYKKTQGGEGEEVEGEEGGEEEDTTQDVYWMPTPTLLRTITFVAKTDVNIIEQWFAFEVYRKDSDGSFVADIEVDVQINITYVQNGEVVLDNVLATESTVAQDGVFTVTKGLYDFDNNDNSVDLNVIDLLDDSIRWQKMGPYNGVPIPERLELFNSPYNVAPTSSHKSSAQLNVGGNYIQFSFTPIKASIVQGDTRESYNGDVYFRLAIFDTIY